jgi:hypothetical protein
MPFHSSSEGRQMIWPLPWAIACISLGPPVPCAIRRTANAAPTLLQAFRRPRQDPLSALEVRGSSFRAELFLWYWRDTALAKLVCRRYAAPVTEKEVTEFGSSKTQGEQAAMRLFLCSFTPGHSFNGGLGGEAFGLAGGLVYRSSNPAQFRHPHFVRGGLTAITKESHMSNSNTPNNSPVKLRPLSSHGIGEPVLLINSAADHAHIAAAADDRINMLRILTNVLSSSVNEAPGEADQADICLVLHTLVEEAGGLFRAAYDFAVAAGSEKRCVQ